MPNGKEKLTDEEREFLDEASEIIREEVVKGTWSVAQHDEAFIRIYNALFTGGVEAGSTLFPAVIQQRQFRAETEAKAAAEQAAITQKRGRIENFWKEVNAIMETYVPLDLKMRALEGAYRDWGIAAEDAPYKAIGQKTAWDWIVEQAKVSDTPENRAERERVMGLAEYARQEPILARKRALRERELRTPEFGPAWAETLATLPGPQPLREWFESRYSSLVRRFQAAPLEEVEKGWPEFLKREIPKLYEERWSMAPFQRGEAPGRYAPPIRTVAR